MPAIVPGSHPYRQIWLCAILVLLTVAVRTPLLGIPFERDEGEYAYIGWRLGHHELPYRDWVDQKPPAIFWVYRLALLLPLDAVRAAHLMGLVFSAAAACALFFLALRFMRAAWAFVAGLLFVLLSADPLLYGPESNTELFMLLPLILSLLAFFAAEETTVKRREILLTVLAGIFIGVAAAFKQVAAVQWPLLIFAAPLLAGGKKPFARMLSFAGWSAAGIAVVWAAIVFYFQGHHALHDFVYNVFTHNLEYIHGVPWSRRWAYFSGTVESLAMDELPVWIFGGIGLLALLASGRTRELGFFLAWLAASAAGVSASGYFFPHYFQQLLPVICIAAALGADAVDGMALWKRVSGPLRKLTVSAILMVPVGIVLYPFLAVYTPAEAVDRIYPGSHFAEKQILAQRLAAVTRPDERVFIFGADTEILFYARRVSATRYIFLFPLYGPYSDAKEQQEAAAQEIVRHTPAAALYLPNQLFFTAGTEQYFTEWTRQYLSGNFRVDTYLALDATGAVEIVTDVPHQKPSALDGLNVFGELDVRKAAVKP